MKVATERLLEEQIAVVVVLESGKKEDAMWHVPHSLFLLFTFGFDLDVLRDFWRLDLLSRCKH